METSENKRTQKEERAAVLERYGASGKTQKAFCESEGLALSTLRSWLKRESRVGAFAEVTPSKQHSPVVELSFPDGSVLRIRSA